MVSRIHQGYITYDVLCHLFNGRHLAISVPGWAGPDICRVATARFAELSSYDYYVNHTESINRIGPLFSRSRENEERRKTYYKAVPSSLEKVKQLFLPDVTPIDALRLELSSIWPKGCLKEMAMFLGACHFEEKCIPHRNIIQRESTEIQLTAVVCLRIPGTVEIWEETHEECKYEYERDEEGVWQLTQRSIERLLPPTVAFQPQAGALLLFNSQNISSGPTGLKQSCFVGFRGFDKPLTVWS